MGKIWTVFMSLLLMLCTLPWAVDGFPLLDRTLEGLSNGTLGSSLSWGRLASDSSLSAGCVYRGVVALTVANRVLFTGLYNMGSVRVTTDALDILKLSNRFNELIIYGDDGTATASIERNALNEGAVRSHIDGTSFIRLSRDFSLGETHCPSNDAHSFHTALQLDLHSCSIVSYGGYTTKTPMFSGIVKVNPLQVNRLKGCCSHILPNIVSNLIPWGLNLGNPDRSVVTSSFTCVRSKHGICRGDIGSPVYCRHVDSGQFVAVGMVDTGVCQDTGEYVGVIDLTSGTLPGFSRHSTHSPDSQ